jgi:pyruvate dehydrogenase E2 component (dihydrolipoamide acetyltransferase)
MARSFKLPDLGEGIHEGEVLAVLVTVGQEVNEGDIIIEVETDKAAVEIPSPYTGTVDEIFVKPGDVVKVGDVMMTFSNGQEAAVEEIADKAKEIVAAPTSVEATVAEVPPRKAGPVPASPATRRVARELEVDLRQVPPTGPAGLVTA